MLSTYSGSSGTLPPPPGASMTKCGTASPDVHPRNAYDLEALLDGRAEVFSAGHLIRHVDVVRPDSALEELLHQLLHDGGRIVHAAEQHRLTSQRDAGIGQLIERFHGCRGEFARMVEVGVHVDGMVPLHHLAELVG